MLPLHRDVFRHDLLILAHKVNLKWFSERALQMVPIGEVVTGRRGEKT